MPWPPTTSFTRNPSPQAAVVLTYDAAGAVRSTALSNAIDIAHVPSEHDLGTRLHVENINSNPGVTIEMSRLTDAAGQPEWQEV